MIEIIKQYPLLTVSGAFLVGMVVGIAGVFALALYLARDHPW